jgi:hypothetical protein
LVGAAESVLGVGVPHGLGVVNDDYIFTAPRLRKVAPGAELSRGFRARIGLEEKSGFGSDAACHLSSL